MTEGATRWIDRYLGRLVTVVVAGTIVCLGWGVYLQFQVSSQAQEGATARARQRTVFPISVKYIEWAAKHPDSRITADDVTCFKTGRRCPPMTPKTP